MPLQVFSFFTRLLRQARKKLPICAAFIAKNNISRGIFFLIIAYSIYMLFCVVQYSGLPAPKKDIRIRAAINSQFPRNYDVTIKSADLVGLGEKFYVAYGNKQFLKQAYTVGPKMREALEAKVKETNRPMVKLFYVREPGLLAALLSLLPLGNIQDKIAELSIKKYFDFAPIIVEGSNSISLEKANQEFARKCTFPATFSITNIVIADIDQDDKDEIVAEWLWFGGGSGGTRWCSVFELKGDKLNVSSGYPGVFNIDFSKYLWAILRYAGLLGAEYRNRVELEGIIDKMDLEEPKKKVLLVAKPVEKDVLGVLYKWSLKPQNQTEPSQFINAVDNTRHILWPRTTGDYCKFVKINDQYVYVDAYFVADRSCHWCEHYWRIMCFLYREGRWISDRNVNGNSFKGIWLDEKRAMTLNEVFGTYADQGLMGFAYSFLNPDWTPTSISGVADTLGAEMRLASPVDRKLRAIYRDMK